MTDSAQWRHETWQDLTFEVPATWTSHPGPDLVLTHPTRADITYTPTLRARYLDAQGRTITQSATLTAAVMTSLVQEGYWLDVLPVRLQSGTATRLGRRQVFVQSSSVGDLITYLWLFEAGDLLLEVSAYCTVAQSVHLQPLLLHLGDSITWNPDRGVSVAQRSTDDDLLGQRLQDFPAQEPRWDEITSAAYGMPLESLSKVRGSQAWRHDGEWLDTTQQESITSTAQAEAEHLHTLGLDPASPSGAHHPALTALSSPHRHSVALYTTRGDSVLDVHLSTDGFAGWSGPDIQAFLSDGEAEESASTERRQFISGDWSLLSRLTLSWTGVAPAWVGWPPLQVPWSYLESKTRTGAPVSATPTGLPPELASDRWWLFVLQSQASTPEPWLVTESHGCFAITGEPDADHVVLAQVSPLTVFTEINRYWDQATDATRTLRG